MSIWLTRPYDDSQHMADLLATHGIRSIIAPLMNIEPTEVTWPARMPDALLLTSRYGARALATTPAEWRALPVYCAGPATAQAALKQGFENILAVETGVVDLLPLLRTHHSGQHVLYPSGEDIKIDVAPLLAPHGITVERVIAYNARAKDQLPATLLHAFADGSVSGIIFASPRSVQIARDLLKQNKLSVKASKLDLYCLSVDIAAEAARQIGGEQVYACPLPSYDAMMELLLNHATRGA